MNRSDYAVIAIIVALLVVALEVSLISFSGAVLPFFIAVSFAWGYFCWKTRWWKKDEGA
jgi:hypothetical protein